MVIVHQTQRLEALERSRFYLHALCDLPELFFVTQLVFNRSQINQSRVNSYRIIVALNIFEDLPSQPSNRVE